MKTWLLTHHSKLQFGLLRMTVAALAAYAIGEALRLSQVYWAVLSAVIVIQGSVGGSVKAGLNRLAGTAGGALWGAIVAMLIVHNGPSSLALALVVAVAPLALLTGFRIDYRIAPITAIIVLMGTAPPQATPFSSALERVLEITLGSAIAVAVALIIFPARAHAMLLKALSAAIADMARIATIFAESHGEGVDHEALLKRQLRLNADIEKIGARAAEAKVERRNRLTDNADPESLVRTLRRLRNDITMMARALVMPLPHAHDTPFCQRTDGSPSRSRPMAGGDVGQPLGGDRGARSARASCGGRSLPWHHREPWRHAGHSSGVCHRVCVRADARQCARSRRPRPRDAGP